MTDTASLADQVAVRAWKLNEKLDLADIPREDRKGLFMEITHEEAADLLRAA